MSETLSQILSRRFNGGTRVINCVAHAYKPITERSRDCDLCFTDMQNHITYCHRVNDWLNTVLEDARKGCDDMVKRVQGAA